MSHLSLDITATVKQWLYSRPLLSVLWGARASGGGGGGFLVFYTLGGYTEADM